MVFTTKMQWLMPHIIKNEYITKGKTRNENHYCTTKTQWLMPKASLKASNGSIALPDWTACQLTRSTGNKWYYTTNMQWLMPHIIKIK